MITEKDVANTILIRKNQELGTHKRNSLKSAIPTVEQDAQHQLTLMFALSKSSNILFSERVILLYRSLKFQNQLFLLLFGETLFGKRNS